LEKVELKEECGIQLRRILSVYTSCVYVYVCMCVCVCVCVRVYNEVDGTDTCIHTNFRGRGSNDAGSAWKLKVPDPTVDKGCVCISVCVFVCVCVCVCV